ncbi:MAG: 30S ribosomal protein S6 [Candidatus Omnitrophica bacterium]|nr:30S ribosomal protein S6 [Candidatus Omnitrophota bacterium]
MKSYEGLLILKPDLEKEQLQDIYQKLQENIKKHKGEIEGADELGKKALAYKIGKFKEGIYYLTKLKIEPSQIKALGSDLKLNEHVLRFMFTQLFPGAAKKKVESAGSTEN